jgi:hypothetical protein
MSGTTKAIIAVVVIALVAAGAYYWYMNGTPRNALTEESTNELPSGTDASDDGLEEDFAAIEAGMDAFVSDTAYIDAGLNDQPVEQESI